MNAAMTPGSAPMRSRAGHGAALAGLVLLLALGLFYVFGAVSDLLADARVGLPVDHLGTYTALAGADFGQTRTVSPGVADYITLLERGYALHELTFAGLFLVIVAVPFRRRQRWAWWSLWLLLIANLGYTVTFGAHDPMIFTRSLIATLGLPVLLLAHLPAFYPRRRPHRHLAAPDPRSTVPADANPPLIIGQERHRSSARGSGASQIDPTRSVGGRVYARAPSKALRHTDA